MRADFSALANNVNPIEKVLGISLTYALTSFLQVIPSGMCTTNKKMHDLSSLQRL
jgi:hypothetical protein